MPDYNRYRYEHDITNNDIIDALKKKFAKYQKSTMTMVNNCWDYGVQLLPEAEAVLVEKFGPGPGLAISESKRSRSHGNTKKPNRLYVRVDDALMCRVDALMKHMHFATVQDFVEAAILQMVDKYGGV